MDLDEYVDDKWTDNVTNKTVLEKTGKHKTYSGKETNWLAIALLGM